MGVPHPGGDPNANRYEQLKRDILARVPPIVDVQYVPNAVETLAPATDGRVDSEQLK